MEFLVSQYIEGCAKATHLHGTIGHNPGSIIRFGKDDGAVGSKSLFTAAEACQQVIRPGDCVLRLTASCEGFKRGKEYSSTT